MTGTPLDVYEKYAYIDPPENVNSSSRVSVFAMIVNPRSYYPTSGNIEEYPPDTIFRAKNYGFTQDLKTENEIRITEPSSFSLRANNVVLTGATGVQSLTVATEQQMPSISSKIELLNSRGPYKEELLGVTYSDDQNEIYHYMGRAENSLAKNSDINSMKGMFDLYGGLAMYETRVLHTWVMCGAGYAILDNGSIYKTTDGFTSDAVEVGIINPDIGNIMRINPGTVAYTQSDYGTGNNV